MRVKKLERLDDASMKEVIHRLNAEQPITKKAACTFLNITYNTTRLTKLITEYEEKVVRERTIRQTLKSKPVSLAEEKEIVTLFLKGEVFSTIEKQTFRSLTVIKRTLAKYNIPLDIKSSGLLDESVVREDYVRGNLVYSVKYDAPAEIIFEAKESDFHGRCYNLYVFGKHQCRAYQAHYELADLTEAQKTLTLSIPGLTGVPSRRLQLKDTE